MWWFRSEIYNTKYKIDTWNFVIYRKVLISLTSLHALAIFSLFKVPKNIFRLETKIAVYVQPNHLLF